MENFRDYIFLPDIWMVTDNGSFIGTPNHLFCIPTKKQDHAYRSISTRYFSFEGKSIPEAISEIIQNSKGVRDIEAGLMEMKGIVPHSVHYDLQKIGNFKVQAGFLGSGIHVKEGQGKFGYKPFIQRLGKQKKEVKAFYQNHAKLD